MKKNGIIAVITAIVAIVIVGGVVIGLNSGRSSRGPAASSAASTSNEIEIKNYAFKPASVTVKVGTTVTWTNKDAVVHTVTADASSSDKFDSGDIQQGGTFSYTFKQTGTYPYHCTPHPNMKASVTVVN